MKEEKSNRVQGQKKLQRKRMRKRDFCGPYQRPRSAKEGHGIAWEDALKGARGRGREEGV